MTIFHLVRSFGGKRLGGAERNIYNLVQLISLNLEEENIILSEKGLWKYCKKNNNFKKLKINIFIFLIFSSNKINNIHVHSNGYYIFLGYLISILIKSKLIIKITRIGDGSLINRRKEKKFDIRLLVKRNLFKYICKSNNVYIQILSKSCFDIISRFSKKIIVFPNVIKKGEFNPMLKEKDTFVISSRLIKRKNIDLALDNLLNLKNKKIKIFILGDGPEFNRLKSKYEINKSQISFLGYLKNQDIQHYYAKAEYFINLSESEGMSNSLIEAMSYGCKCIVSAILENSYTAENYAVYYDQNKEFSIKMRESLKLSPEDISNYANSKFSVDFFNSDKLKELYKIDNSNLSCRERK